ncbi:MAG: flippase [Acidobacteria bacterium]|nr:flippase [Acidobacteriota bacterium]
MAEPLEIHGSLLARNTVLNLAGHAVPLVVGLVSIPYVVRGLGNEGFGILSIAWVLLGYFGLFDLGLGRATTKFVAECLGRGEMERLPRLVWTSLGSQLVFGLIGSLIFGIFVPVLVDRILKIPPALLRDAKLSFWLLAGSLPVVLATTALRSVLESAQRFDLVNYVKVPANISVFLLPAIAVAFGLHLPGIILLLVLSRLVATLAYLDLCVKLFPTLAHKFSVDSALLRPLLSYGGWITVSGVVSPVLVYLDRFVIGALITMAAVGYYTAPAEMVGRLSIFPGSLIVTLFPAFSSLDAFGAKERLENLYARSIKFLLLTLGPALVLLAVFARQLLQFWLGSDFATHSTIVLQILAGGVVLNSLALVPYTLIQGLGRPDVTAKFHLLELPLYAVLVWVLVERWGISGAAIAWTMRVSLDALLLFGAAWRLRFASVRTLAENGLLKSFLAVLMFALALALAVQYGSVLLTQIALSALLLGLFTIGAWRFVLDNGDRTFLAGATGQVLASLRSA